MILLMVLWAQKRRKRIVPEVVKKIQTFDGTVFATRDTHEENYLETAEGKKTYRSDIVSVEQKAGRSDRRSQIF